MDVDIDRPADQTRGLVRVGLLAGTRIAPRGEHCHDYRTNPRRKPASPTYANVHPRLHKH
jgi:hypothetical protein